MKRDADKPNGFFQLHILACSRWRSCFAACLGCWLTAFGEPLEAWHWRNPVPTGNRLYGIGASAQRYVAVGELGTILVSDDGNNWLAVDSETQNTLRAVAWGNGLWVAVGDFGRILTSSDGVTWTPRSAGFFFDLMGITWGGGLFVAVGENTSILTSTDGIQWTLRAMGTHPLRTIVWANGTFVAAGGEPPALVPAGGGFDQRVAGQPLVLISRDGIAWTAEETPVDGQVSSIAFGGGRFVAATTSMQTMVSTNGEQWLAGLESQGDGPEFTAVAYVGDRFIATYAGAYTTFGNYFVSLDGETWTTELWDMETGPFYGNVRALTFGPHGAAGVADGLGYSLLHYLIVSSDGRKWHQSVKRLPGFETSAAFAGGRFFLREQSGYANPYEQRTETTYLVSADGQKWESTVVADAEWFGLPAYGSGIWAAGGSGGHVVISTNAVDWQQLDTGQTNQLLHTAFAGGKFVVSGANGTLLTSVDGVNWMRQALDTTNTLGEVAWSGGIFAVREVGTAAVFTSSDSILWSRQLMPTNVALTDTLMGWEEGFLALVRTNQYSPAQLLRSTDGRAWSPETPPTDDIFKIATGGGRLLAFRGNGSRTFHARGAGETNWTTLVLPWVTMEGSVHFFAPADVAFGQDTFLLIHGAGYVLQSDPLTNAPPRLTQPLAAVTISLNELVTLKAIALGSAPLRYQWRRDGTNLPSATAPFLTLPANEILAKRITVVVENAFDMTESPPATVTVAAPARLEIAPDLSALRVWGTPNGRYRVEFTDDLASAIMVWSFFQEVELPSFGTPSRVKNLSAYDLNPVPHRYYHAVARP